MVHLLLTIVFNGRVKGEGQEAAQASSSTGTADANAFLDQIASYTLSGTVEGMAVLRGASSRQHDALLLTFRWAVSGDTNFCYQSSLESSLDYSNEFTAVIKGHITLELSDCLFML